MRHWGKLKQGCTTGSFFVSFNMDRPDTQCNSSLEIIFVSDHSLEKHTTAAKHAINKPKHLA